jgi:hypothetical protein
LGVSKKKLFLLTFTVILLLMILPFLSGCTQETFSQPDDPPVSSEKTQEEIEAEEKAQRLREEEEHRLAEERKMEERRLREEALKAELGHFYVPLPPEEVEDNPAVKAKGIYVTGHTVGQTARFAGLLSLLESTELNAMVIDVKNDHGKMSYKSKIAIVNEIRADSSVPIKDIEALMATLKEKDIYPIARIVVFRDPYMAEQRPEWAIQKNGGGVWRDYKKFAWVNPYEKNIWDYTIAIAKEAALLGFREIQFDYVRFPENASRVDREAYYPGNNGVEKDHNIANFISYAREQLKDYNVHIAADVFGVIATSWGDSDRIGQNWEQLSPLLEYICPMVYPSHYGPGYFGFPVPDANPAGTIRRSMADSVKRNAPLETPAIIRPWLQSFTATWVPGYISYGAKEVRQQIEAALEFGIDEYMIWNAGNRYFNSAFLTAEEAGAREEKAERERREKGHDLLGRTSSRALEEYLGAVRRKNWREAFVLHSTGFTLDHDLYKDWVGSWTAALTSFKINSNEAEGERFTFELDLTLTQNGEKVNLEGQSFEVFIENRIWRVKPSVGFIELLTKTPENQS